MVIEQSKLDCLPVCKRWFWTMRSDLDTLGASVTQQATSERGLRRVYLKAPQLLLASPQLIEFARSWVSTVRSLLTALVIRGLLGYVLAGVPNLKAINRSAEAAAICSPIKSPVETNPCVSCDVLYEPPGGEEAIHADVIFIHGLHGSLVNTWRQGRWRSKHRTGIPRTILRPEISPDEDLIDTVQDSAGESSREQCVVGCACPNCYSPCWPKDWLPVDCPNARVIALNYTTDPYLWRPIWVRKSNRTTLQRRADEMVLKLLSIGVGERPIVWVGHSKGGLFIKQMYTEAYEQMIYDRTRSWDENTSSWSARVERNSPAGSVNLWLNTKAFLFYSVPHRGSNLAGIRSPLLARSVELLEIAKDSAEVLALQNRWLKAVDAARNASMSPDLETGRISEWEVSGEGNAFSSDEMIILGDMRKREGKRPHVVSFVETVKTFMAVMWLTIVSVESADAGVGVLCGVPLDHREICKPSGRGCFLYRELVDMILSATRENDTSVVGKE